MQPGVKKEEVDFEGFLIVIGRDVTMAGVLIFRATRMFTRVLGSVNLEFSLQIEL